jgi:hypothetical protein
MGHGEPACYHWQPVEWRAPDRWSTAEAALADLRDLQTLERCARKRRSATSASTPRTTDHVLAHVLLLSPSEEAVPICLFLENGQKLASAAPRRPRRRHRPCCTSGIAQVEAPVTDEREVYDRAGRKAGTKSAVNPRAVTKSAA